MKRIISFLLAGVLALSLAACSGNGGGSSVPPATDPDPSSQVSSGTSNEPTDISEQRFDGVTLELFFLIGTSNGPVDEMQWFKDLSEQTGITLDMETVSQRSDAVERINLMLQSSQTPDVLMNGPTDAQISSAAAAGKIVELTPLIDQYMPTWKEYFETDDYGRKVATMMDGKIWSLPKVAETGINLKMRDEWMINVKWLDELGLDMPTNTDEFYEVLKAFKDNAGKGSIPENVIPWAARFNPAGQDYTNGGFYELFNAFGAFSGQDFTSVDENGKIYFSATDTKMIAALEYLHKLYAEGLLQPEIFTDKQTDLDAKKFADPPVVGTFLHFANLDLEKENYDALPPMTSPQNDTPMYRSQENSKVARNYYTIFSTCENIEAALCLAETMGKSDWSMQGSYGMFGTALEKKDDGTYYAPSGVDPSVVSNNVPGVVVPLLVTEELTSKLEQEEDLRGDDVKKYYEEYCVSLDRLLPPVLMSDEDLQKVSQIKTDLLNHITQTYANWIVNGNVEAGFDQFVQECENLGLNTYIELYQKALDSFNAN